jgi:hypothetical protein
MKKIITAIVSCILGMGFSINAATINVSGCLTTNYSTIGAHNQFLGQFTTDITGDSLSFGAMTFHANTTNLFTSISIVQTNGDLFAPLDYIRGMDQTDSDQSSFFTFLLPPSYPLGVHTYQLRGTLSSSFTNGEMFSVYITPASDWQSGQTDSTGDPVEATPATQISFGTLVALTPQTIKLHKVSDGIGTFVINGKRACTYQVLESFDLYSWHPIGVAIVAPSDQFQFDLPVTSSQAFYRFSIITP